MEENFKKQSKNVILVDAKDLEIGVCEKYLAHKEGKLHRAFSVVVDNRLDEMLIHKRAKIKYHSAGLWSNCCCSHPEPGIDSIDYAKIRLYEEMGFSCNLYESHSFIYRIEFENGLIEHELDHVLLGKYDGKVNPDHTEVEEYRWVKKDELNRSIEKKPSDYTHWFRLIMKQIA